MRYCLLCCYKVVEVVLTFESSCVNEILNRDHSNESHWAVTLCRIVYHAVQGCSNFLSFKNKLLDVSPSFGPILQSAEMSDLLPVSKLDDVLLRKKG